jgi:hypothetical protein
MAGCGRGNAWQKAQPRLLHINLLVIGFPPRLFCSEANVKFGKDVSEVLDIRLLIVNLSLMIVNDCVHS